jgi:manganese/zinc/iron transport system permease protein
MTPVSALLDALLLNAGYNTVVVMLGAALLGAGAGAIGVFVLLRRRALASDAIAHATLPGIALAFIASALFTGHGRILPVLLLGAAATAGLGILAVHWVATRTRLPEDAAIATVMSTFFALGIVAMTVVQNIPASGAAGLESFLLGATAGMLRAEAELIAAGALAVLAAVLLVQKELGLICFDPDFAKASGYNVRRLDLLALGLLLAVVVIGLTTVGLILIIALAIIPPVAARLWTERLVPMVLIAAGIGAAGCYIGAAVSSTAPRLPAGAVIVLTLFGLFAVSLIFSPVRGIGAAAIRHWRFRNIVHARQGLLAIARDEPVFDPATRRILRRKGFLRRTGLPTPAGRAAASRMMRDQALWNRYRDLYPDDATALDDWSLRPIEDVLPPDLIADLEGELRPRPVEAAP